MRTRSELEAIKSFVDSTYNRFGNLLILDVDKEYDPELNDLGYCFKFKDKDSGHVVYKIVCSKIGIDRTDFRVMMHEYGHIYLGHMDGIHEDLDSSICNVFNNYRDELIAEVNKNCGINFADKLIERVIDDPFLNHQIHNIAMDMEVNSSVLSKEDIEEMEKDITSALPKTDEELLKYLQDHAVDPAFKKDLQDRLDQMQKESKIKLMIPERFGFPNDLTYVEYLMLIIKNMDKFVKMLVDIQMGGNGDTSNVTQQDIQNALNQFANMSPEYQKGYNDALRDYNNGQVGKSMQNQQMGQQQQGQSGQGQPQQDQGNQNGQGMPGQGMPGQGNMPGSGGQPSSGQGSGNSQPGGNGGSQSSAGQGDYQKGYNDALNDIANGQVGSGQGMQGLSNLMSDLGLTEDSNSDGQDGRDGDGKDGEGEKKESPYKGTRSSTRQDHNTDSRVEADNLRKLGKIRSKGGIGCGSNGGSEATREVDKNVDEVDMALKEVMLNFKNKVVKIDTKKDLMKLYNKGINRSVIAPTVSRKVTISNQPKIVYLIDISGSMDTRLVDRILKTIGHCMRKLNRGLKYDIITWNTGLGEHIKNVDPKKGVPRIHMGGGTSLARGIEYFRDNYKQDAILIVISDFEDYLEEWHKVEENMPGYLLYGFNYGSSNYYDSDKINWKHMKIRKFSNR